MAVIETDLPTDVHDEDRVHDRRGLTIFQRQTTDVSLGRHPSALRIRHDLRQPVPALTDGQVAEQGRHGGKGGAYWSSGGLGVRALARDADPIKVRPTRNGRMMVIMTGLPLSMLGEVVQGCALPERRPIAVNPHDHHARQ
jgi:hypothetical protein